MNRFNIFVHLFLDGMIDVAVLMLAFNSFSLFEGSGGGGGEKKIEIASAFYLVTGNEVVVD